MSSEPLFGTVCFIGIGLIGSPLARVIRRDGLAREVGQEKKGRRPALARGIPVGLADAGPLVGGAPHDLPCIVCGRVYAAS